MSLSALMSAFAELPGADVGRGPDHPAEPDSELRPAVEEFLRWHPALAGDAGYVEFLFRYSGASVEDYDSDRFVDVLGFGRGATHFNDLDGPVVDEDGFLMFASVARRGDAAKGEPDTIEYDYAFDTTGERAPGVYRYDAFTGRPSVPYRLVAPDFTAWLAEVVSPEQ